MKRIILLIFFIITTIFICCKKETNTTLRFEGTVIDTLGLPVSNAEIILYSLWDLTLYQKVYTDNNGFYSLTHEGCTFQGWTMIAAKATGFFTEPVEVQHCTESLQAVNFELEPIFNCGSILEDNRDGKEYPTIKIGDLCWMAENLNIGNRIDGVVNQNDNNVIEKYCYDDNETNCDVYGGLYQWDEMMQYDQYYVETDFKGICPKGWHIPRSGMSEWSELLIYLGGYDVAGGKMKEVGTFHWNTPNTGATNESGFTALPGGWHYKTNGSFNGKGTDANFWGTTTDSLSASMHLLSYDSYTSYSYMYLKTHGLSVRCVAYISDPWWILIPPEK